METTVGNPVPERSAGHVASQAGDTLRQWARLTPSLIRRDVGQRYKGTVLGIFWPAATALMTLAIYTFVFSVILKIRWPEANVGPDHSHFALTLFAGLVPFLMLSEVINRAPGLVLATPNLVKKTPFPVAVLPIVAIGSAAVQSVVNLALLLIFEMALFGHLPWTAGLILLAYVPLFLLCLGLAWVLSALGVFIRDLGQILPLLTQVLMFLTPIFYPVSAIPPDFRIYIELNPMTQIVETFRALLLHGQLPDWTIMGLQTVIFGVFALFGLWLFNRLRPAFSDVI